MSRYAVFGLMLVLINSVITIPTIPIDSNDISTVIVDVNSGLKSTFGLQNPSGWPSIFGVQDALEIKNTSKVVELISSSQLNAVPSAKFEGVIRYVIGKRIANDRLVAQGADNKRWTQPMDVTLTVKYPTTGPGAIVTYAEIVVNQSSNIGRAYVLAGGIGRHLITIIVEGKSTLWFSYTAVIYGI